MASDEHDKLQNNSSSLSVKPLNIRELSKLLTQIERDVQSLKPLRYGDLLQEQTKKPCFRIGITGPPGAGKSTLINALIRAWRNPMRDDLLPGGTITNSIRSPQSVAVLAVDPSSPFTGGAILGDRIRYNEHYADPGVYVRSLGSRGSLGGLSPALHLMLRALDHYSDFDIVLIETVGVGQTELEVLDAADLVLVVLVPESGDSIQAMKAGLLEIADIFVVNKSDRPGALSFQKDLESALSLDHADSPSSTRVHVLPTVALTGKGVSELLGAVNHFQQDQSWIQQRGQDKDQIKGEIRALWRARSENELRIRLEHMKSPEEYKSFLKEMWKQQHNRGTKD